MTTQRPPASVRPPPPSSRPPSGQPMVKGLAFRSVLVALEELRGAEAVEATYAKLWPADAETIRLRVVAGNWYPTALYRSLWNGIAEATGARDALAREIGRECMRRDMTGAYRMAFRLLSPETALEDGARVFQSYFDTGKLDVLESRAGYARASFSGCRGFHRLVWMKVLGSAEMALELAGARGPRLRFVRGGLEHDQDAEVLGTWT